MPCRVGENLNKFSTCRTSPKWSFRGRSHGGNVSEARRDNPGPGAYSLNAEFTGHKRSSSHGFGSASTGRGRRDNSTARPSSAPGPGQYAGNQASGVMGQRSSPSYGFGSSSRNKGYSSVGVAEAYGSPGPGQYNGNDAFTRNQHPSYTSTPRRPQSAGAAESTPGPGAYQTSVTARADAREAPKWRFGTASRAQQKEDAAPGPGNYNSNKSMGLGGPKYSMRSKYDDKQQKANDNPGPGAFGGQYTQFDWP